MVARPGGHPQTNNSPFAQLGEGPPGWTFMRIEESPETDPEPRPDGPFVVLACSLVEVFGLWWRKYMSRGAARDEAA